MAQVTVNSWQQLAALPVGTTVMEPCCGGYSGLCNCKAYLDRACSCVAACATTNTVQAGKHGTKIVGGGSWYYPADMVGEFFGASMVATTP